MNIITSKKSLLLFVPLIMCLNSSINAMNEELLDLFKKDQSNRENFLSFTTEDLIELLVIDEYRRNRVAEIIEIIEPVAEDYYHAAMVFQHGKSIDDYVKAHTFAKLANTMGNKDAKWLIAASLDRMLMTQGEKQKYGTQFYYDIEKNKWMLWPYDESTTDKERAEYNVAPLKDLILQVATYNIID